MDRKPVVAIIGRPNVGKSTLFNKLAGRRVAIVEDTPGVTRDRIYVDAEWNGVIFTMIDTGGIEPKTDDLILKAMREQAELAISVADVIVFITDIRSGVTADDEAIATMLLKSRKPVVVCVNKVDSTGEVPPDFYEFYRLGFGEPFAVSSLHGSGTGDLLDYIVELLPETESAVEDDEYTRVAVIGKPNVGKSSIVNHILGEDKVIVSDIPGTTRDATDQYIGNAHGKYIFIDTAGIRRQKKVVDNIERYSVIRAKDAVERSDVCLIMIDAVQGVTEQDEKIAGLAHEAGKCAVIVINKWDLIEKDNTTVKKYENDLKRAFAYMTYAPFIFVSAKTGQRIDRLFKLINTVKAEAERRITTGTLNDILSDAVLRTQPPSDKGRRLKVYYATQTGVKPPTFVLFVNDTELMHFSYLRYIENSIRAIFEFAGTPIRFVVKNRVKDE